MFSLRNKEELAPFKSVVKNPSRAIYRGPRYGPYFGGGDIYIAHRADSNNNSFSEFGHSYAVPSGVQDHYEILAGTKHFSPDDWEVYYLVTKKPSKGTKLN